MIQALPIELANGHIIVTIDGQRVLLDTGSPTSIGRKAHLTILGKAYELKKGFLGINIDGLVELSGIEFDALLGADILQEIAFTLDIRANQMTVSFMDMEYRGETIPISSIFGIPVVKALLQGDPTNCVIDTGAQISYVDKQHTIGLAPVDEVEDFYPGLGKFRVSRFELPIQLGTFNMILKVGTLPADLQGLLLMVKAQAILGTEIFQHYRAKLNFREGLICIQRHDQN